LIDAYDRLIEFIDKHTLDRFFLIDGHSVSVRSKIARELVSNILVHRDYMSAFPAKIIIGRESITTENWSLPKNPGRIDPDNFTPFPKNPILANFFVNIGRADVLGSGVRNLYKFTKIYSGGEPELVDGDVFKTIVPLGLSDIEKKMSNKVSDKMSDMSDNEYNKKIIAFFSEKGEAGASEIAELIGRSSKTATRALLKLVESNILVMSGANRNRKYRLASK
jgi:ATP-dependent DNA helicase RecG